MRNPERWLLVAMLAGAGGCASPSAQASGPAAPAKPGATADEAANAKAKDKLTLAQLELDRQLAAAKVAATKLAAEVELAKQKLALFDRSDAPLRVAKANLELERSKDQVAEAEEELAELQMMYKNADLADKTRDIVLHRSERRLDRQKEALVLATGELELLQQQTLSIERHRLELDLAARTAEFEDGQRGAAIDEMNKRSALRDAELELAKARAGEK